MPTISSGHQSDYISLKFLPVLKFYVEESIFKKDTVYINN